MHCMLHYIKSEEKYQLMAVYAAMLPVVSTRADTMLACCSS